MQSVLDSEHQKSVTSASCAVWPVELKLTHLDWNSDAILIHFQGHYLTICDLDYNILQGEIQNVPKTSAEVDIGAFCIVEDLCSGRWYRGRVQNRKKDLFEVFLIDHGNVLSVDIAHISLCSNDLFILPPKIICGFLANVLLLDGCSHSVLEKYFSSLIGSNVTGYIQALLPHKVLLLEAPDINNDLVRHGFGRHMDTDTFLLLVGMLTEVPLKRNMEPVPDLLLEKPRGQEYSFNPSSLQGYKDILSLCGPRLCCGTRAKVRVTAAIHPGLFYCRKTSMETDLWEMSKKLAAVNEQQAKKHNQKTPENLGLLCSVKGKDGKWQRGYVQFLPVNSQLRVLFIDYGIFESVEVENVHRLPTDLLSTPVMAFPCSLSSLSDRDEAVKSQQLNFLKAGLLGKVLDVEIRGFDEGQQLYSITLIGAEDTDMKEPKLIQELPSKTAKQENPSHRAHLSYETIMDQAVCKTLEAEGVHVDSVFVGYVEYVQNPSHFWIRTQKRNDEFQEMMKKMGDSFNQVKLDDDVLLNPELGTLCCAVYEEDMHFYRGVVTNTLEHGSEVLFIDFGNIQKVPDILIKKIPETFANKPAFAFCCSLVNVSPLDEMWTSTTSEIFRQAVSNKALLVHVVEIRKKQFVVDLHDMESEKNQSITEFLISSKKADYWNNVAIKPVVRNNTYLTEKKHPKYGVTSDTFRNTEQPNDCEKEEETCNIQTQNAQAPACFKALSIKPGCNMAVICSYIKSPSEIWCQPQDNLPALEELMDKVHQYYSTRTVPVRSGDLCCVAKSPQDGRWYRAFIADKQNGHARVMLVDYGFTIQIKEYNLQGIIPEYVYLEEQAFRCCLSGLIEPADPENSGDWGPDVCKTLKELVLNCTSGLRCEVLSQLNVKNKGLCNVVELYNTQTQQRLTNLLLERCVPRKGPILAEQLPTMIPESFVYSSHDLSPGDEEHVYITHIGIQWEIYCHLQRNAKVIDQLEQKIREESEKIIQASTRVVGRRLALAKYFDGNWYRGLAHPVQSPHHLGVFFVDYGNTNVSEKTNVISIPRDSVDLLHTPMQAVKFHLASVSKEELYADVKEWLDGTILNKEVRAIIVGKRKDGSFDVELFDGDININEKVKDIVLSLSPKSKTVVSSDTICTKKEPHTLQTGCTKQSLKCRKVSQMPSKQGRHKSKASRCNQVGRALPNVMNAKHHVPSEQRQHTKELDIPQLSCLPEMKVSAGFRAICFVSHIRSVNSFFLQLSEDEPAILKMGEKLNLQIFRDSLKPAPSLRINDLVLAEYEEDGALYRSAVKECEDGSRFEVEFVDYGNNAVMGNDKIYSIPKEYLSHPRFSISCSLLDTSMYTSDVSFTDAVMEKPLMVDFVSHEVHWKVKFEILDGAVSVPAALEATLESGPGNERGEESPADSFEMEEGSRAREQNLLTKNLSEKKTGESKGTTVDEESPMPKPTHTALSPTVEEPTLNEGDSFKSSSTFTIGPGKTKSQWADAIIPLSIQAKDTEISTVLSVMSNSNFYAKLNKTSPLLIALESRIADNVHKCKMVAYEDVKQGLKCLVQVHQQWHRAVIQDVGLETCQLLLVDHGMTDRISRGSIRHQCSELTEIPHLAVLCKVNCIRFSEGEASPGLWCEILKPMIGKEVKLVFVCFSEADKLWTVEIIMNGEFVLRQIPTSLRQNEESVLSTAETLRSEKAEAELNTDTSLPQHLTFVPVDIDTPYSGFASAVVTPFKFCIILEDFLLVMNKVSLLLDDLPEETSPLPEAHLIPGTCCLFKSNTKSKWCRAEITDVNTTVVLNLVDYGHYECIPYQDCFNLKRAPEEIGNLPKVEYPCVLRGVKPVGVDGQWTNGAAVFFQQCLFQKNLQIIFREFVLNTHWKVDILADGTHVAKKLVDAGHANYMDITLGLRFQEQGPRRAAPGGPGSEEECGQEDGGFNGKTHRFVESTGEAEGTTALSIVSECPQGFLL
ncbi:tudor domain-containing protein 15 [Pungitius pungitius]|uniref:tudor domain-containing protein 15 n=1 Tax=Pungitius pungitius TaxID=134920 RepID=UPI002E162C7F